MSKFDREREARKQAEFYDRTGIPDGNYRHKRGKYAPAAPGGIAWDMRGGDGRDWISDGNKVLDEALGD